MPAFLEEITMRGVVLQNYKGLSIKKAAIANGILFGILHLSPQQFLYATMLGIVFVYFTHYTESLWAPILGHFTINATQILIGTATARMIEAMPEDPQAMAEASAVNGIINFIILLFVLNAIFIPVFIMLFRLFIDYNKQRMIDVEIPLQEPIEEEKQPPVQDSAKAVDWAFIAVIIFYLMYLTTNVLYQ